MAFNIEESFEVEASVEDAWAFFSDPRRVVVCLPGAEVTGTIDDRSYEGRVRVKVGPVTAKYKGVVRLEEEDVDALVVRLQGEGKETGGSGSARMSMTGRLTALSETRTRVEVEAAVDVAGKLARFGRAVMEDVSRQLFREFAKNTQERLARNEPAAVLSGDAPSGGAPFDEAPIDEAPSGDAPAGGGLSDRALSGGGHPGGAPKDFLRSERQEPPPRRREGSGTSTAEEGAQPLRLPGLLLRALASRLKRLIGG
jgi:hypothetical protein